MRRYYTEYKKGNVLASVIRPRKEDFFCYHALLASGGVGKYSSALLWLSKACWVYGSVGSSDLRLKSGFSAFLGAGFRLPGVRTWVLEDDPEAVFSGGEFGLSDS